MFIKKLFLFFLFLFILPKTVLSAENFLVSSEVTYDVLAESSTKVSHKILITNTKTEVHATDYTLTLSGANISKVSAYDSASEFETEVTELNGKTSIKVIFKNPVVGEGASREFWVDYINTAVVNKNGDIREINIPRLANESSYDAYLVRLKIPTSFGTAAYISPSPDNSLASQESITYYFDKTVLNKAGVTAAFGESQIFSFDLTYHLQNPLALPTVIDIALPPDTSSQKIVYDSLSPLPDNVYQDGDGNWLAKYTLAPRERVDVRALGTARIFATPWRKYNLTAEERAINLRATKYWQVDSPDIKALAMELKTPRAIYDYVVSTLSYDYEKISQGTDRLGAVEALNNPSGAICTEFTDVFITLARAAGIPAREVNGYAHTDNKTLQPLALVADVLHAWPEYWDDEKSIWVPVDPTWGDTTGGIDYFDKLDMKHLAFVMHGANPESPIPPGSYKLGANPQKDVFVSLGESTEEKSVKPEITLSQKNTVPFSGIKLRVNISNNSGVALYDKSAQLFFDGQMQYERALNVLLPYETKIIEFSIPYGFLGNNTPREVTLLSGDEKFVFNPDKNPAIIRDLASMGFIIIVIAVIAFLIFRKKK